MLNGHGVNVKRTGAGGSLHSEPGIENRDRRDYTGVSGRGDGADRPASAQIPHERGQPESAIAQDEALLA